MTALSILEAINIGVRPLDEDPSKLHSKQNTFSPSDALGTQEYLAELSADELAYLFTPFDLKRLESYGNNLLDYHVILDLMPTVAALFFENRLGGHDDDAVHLGAVQSAILLGLGLQRREVEDIEVSPSSTSPLASALL